MLEKYPYNDDFEAWEVGCTILDESVTVLAQAPDEMEFIKRSVELRQRIEWLNDKGQDICDLLSSRNFSNTFIAINRRSLTVSASNIFCFSV